LSIVIFEFSQETFQSTKKSKLKWDIGGDDFSLKDSEILQIASLSLDEPELEEVFFNEDEQIYRDKHYDLQTFFFLC